MGMSEKVCVCVSCDLHLPLEHRVVVLAGKMLCFKLKIKCKQNVPCCSDLNLLQCV